MKERLYLVIYVFLLFLFLPRIAYSGAAPDINIYNVSVFEIGTSHTPGQDRTGGTLTCYANGDVDTNCPDYAGRCLCDPLQRNYYYRIEVNLQNVGPGATTPDLANYSTLTNLDGSVDISGGDVWIADDGSETTDSGASFDGSTLNWTVHPALSTADEIDRYCFIILIGSSGSTTDGAYFYVHEPVKDLEYDAWVDFNVTVAEDTTPPQWSNPDVNVTNPSRGEPVNISVVWNEPDSGLDFSWLETNETGSWENKTDYGSPRDISGTGPLTVNFTWTNDTGKPRVIGWRIYANNTDGYENGTNNPSGAYEGNFTMWGWSNITWTSPDDGSVNVSDIVKLVCFVNDTNTTGSGPIDGYNVNFYNVSSTTESFLGTNYTNSSGYAVWNWNTTGLLAGTYYPKCNITDNSTLYYNASEYNQANTTVFLENFVAINISSALLRGVLFGSVTANTDDNMAENDTTSPTYSNCTEYWIGPDPSTTGPIHLWHYADDMTRGGVTTDKILIGNVTHHANQTANGVNVNMTEWKVSTSVALTTSWTKIGGAAGPCDNLAIGDVCYIAYWLDVPSNIPSGTYNTTYNYCGNLTSTSVSCDG